jgi:hypothetical protein
MCVKWIKNGVFWDGGSLYLNFATFRAINLLSPFEITCTYGIFNNKLKLRSKLNMDSLVGWYEEENAEKLNKR